MLLTFYQSPVGALSPDPPIVHRYPTSGLELACSLAPCCEPCVGERACEGVMAGYKPSISCLTERSGERVGTLVTVSANWTRSFRSHSWQLCKANARMFDFFFHSVGKTIHRAMQCYKTTKSTADQVGPLPVMPRRCSTCHRVVVKSRCFIKLSHQLLDAITAHSPSSWPRPSAQQPCP